MLLYLLILKISSLNYSLSYVAEHSTLALSVPPPDWFDLAMETSK